MTFTLARFDNHHAAKDSGWLQCTHPDCDAHLESDHIRVTEHRTQLGVSAVMLRHFADHLAGHDARHTGGHGAVQE